MFSIDQNCHSLWDALPKLQALAGRGHRVTHFLEDVDVAFTAVGAGLAGAGLQLARERFHRSGGADWGAALFYSDFLGRLPVDVRDWEPFTGVKTAVLAKQLGRTVDDLFDEFSPGDNWQLIGPSYVGDRAHHRVIGDLSVAETAGFCRQIFQMAADNMRQTFPQADSQRRLDEWLGKEQHLLESLLIRHADGRLVDLYRTWLGQYLGETVRLDATFNLLATGADPRRTALLEVFLADYDLSAGLYNQAVVSTGVKLRPLRTGEGELPFFAVLHHQGHLVRTGVFLRDGRLVIGQRDFRLGGGGRIGVDELTSAGVHCLAGKAALLTIQVRLRPGGAPLAVPYRGSAYMPASHRLAESLGRHGLLPGELHPITRVRFRLLERLRSLTTTIRLPQHLAGYFSGREIPAGELADAHADVAEAADRRLESIKDPAGRKNWQEQNFPELTEELSELDKRRRKLAETDPKSSEIRDLWKRVKTGNTELLDRTVRQIDRDLQARQIDYWDSRGALLPWSIALGGQGFYNELIAKAEIYEEPPRSCRNA